jgi:protein arginine kinase activator
MKCELCQDNEAVVHFKQVVNGDVRELYVCKDCAVKNGFDVQSPMALTDFLFGLGMPESEVSDTDEKTCPSCGLTLGALRKSSRLGCARCYETFSEELDEILQAMHRADRHVGKLPAGEKLTSEILSMQRALERAVSTEDFEEAAKLRDAIRDLKAEHGSLHGMPSAEGSSA